MTNARDFSERFEIFHGVADTILRPRVLAFFVGVIVLMSGASKAIAQEDLEYPVFFDSVFMDYSEEPDDTIDLPVYFVASEIPPEARPVQPTPPPIVNPPQPCLDCRSTGTGPETGPAPGGRGPPSTPPGQSSYGGRK